VLKYYKVMIPEENKTCVLMCYKLNARIQILV
jgi:hypothetical protein